MTSDGLDMTWVVGTPTAFGYAAGISDIRVSWPGGIVRDCLQKIYPVGRFIATGFSGCVEFGFWAVNDLRSYLGLNDRQTAWRPGWVAFKWYRRARRMFAGQSEAIKHMGASIMLLGASPNVDTGIPGFALATVAVLRSPDFFPHVLTTDSVGSIGRGSMVDVYAQELLRLNADRSLWQMEAGIPGGYGFMLHTMIQRVIEDHPEATVSPHVHYCLVRRGEVLIGNSDRTIVTEAGDWTEVRMPPVATSWAEFLAMAQALGADALAASC